MLLIDVVEVALRKAERKNARVSAWKKMSVRYPPDLPTPRPSDPLLDETASQIGINEPWRRTTNRVAKR